jgi:hypothetical protein
MTSPAADRFGICQELVAGKYVDILKCEMVKWSNSAGF